MEKFKKAQVVMLPTKNKSNFGLIHEIKELYIYIDIDDPHNIANALAIEQHLYIISDDEIQKGDWAYCIKANRIFQIKSLHRIDEDTVGYAFISGGVSNSNECKKITATTNILKIHEDSFEFGSPQNENYLPQPSKQFIEKYIEFYNKGEIITNILVEYEGSTVQTYPRSGRDCGGNEIYEWIEELVVNPKDNTVTIKSEKESWNRDEVRGLLIKFHNEFPDRFNINDWISENL